jgi:lipopolysaccharide biosynthesis regulator YciM
MSWDHPAVVGLLIAMPSVWLGWLAYRRSVRANNISAVSKSSEQVYQGLDQLIDALQEDNASLRVRNQVLSEQLAAAAQHQRPED